MKNPAQPADTLDRTADRQIGELVPSDYEAGLPTGGTSAAAMSPLKAAILTMSHDWATVMRNAAQFQKQGKALETFARALSVDMEQVKAVILGMKSKLHRIEDMPQTAEPKTYYRLRMLLEVTDVPEGVTEWWFTTTRQGDRIAVDAAEAVPACHKSYLATD